jgi:hypothetical protein
MMINLSVLMNSLQAKTNDINFFYKKTWQCAWDKCDKMSFYYNGAICFPCDNIILARLEIFNYFFMPHPFNNLYHDILLEKENTIGMFTLDLAESKSRNRKMFFLGAGVGSALIIPVFLSYILIMKKNENI